MTERSPEFYSPKNRTLQEQIEAGEIVHLENVPMGSDKPVQRLTPEGSSYLGVDEQTERNWEHFRKLRDKFGSDAVIVTIALDPETNQADKALGELGIYIDAAAFEAAQSPEPGEASGQ